MLHKLNFGLIKILFEKIKRFSSNINPRYQLSLDDEFFNIKDKDTKYRFKSFGDHSFPAFSYNEIKQNKDILFSVNPYDLIKISEKNCLHEYLKNQLKIDELLRNNLYKLSNRFDSNVFSGDEICDNPLLMEQILKNDLFKIAYNTGFSRGRALSKFAAPENDNHKAEKKLVQLKCIVNNEFNGS